MTEISKRIQASFYRTTAGSEPVREWLRGISVADRRIVGADIATVEFGWPVGMPTCRPLGNELWEVRSHLTGGRIGRVIFTITADRMILLHAFEKTTRKTPLADIRLAIQRRKVLKT